MVHFKTIWSHVIIRKIVIHRVVLETMKKIILAMIELQGEDDNGIERAPSQVGRASVLCG